MRFLWAISAMFATLFNRREDRPLVWWLMLIMVGIVVAAIALMLILQGIAK